MSVAVQVSPLVLWRCCRQIFQHLYRAYAQIFNLVVAGRLGCPGSEIRKATCRILRLIGQVRGLSLASIFRAALEENLVSSSVIDYQKRADAWVLGGRSQDRYTAGSHIGAD